MGLSATVDFLESQKQSDGRRLATLGQGTADITLGPQASITVVSIPDTNIFMHYAYIERIDGLAVPGALSLTVTQYNANTFTGTLGAGLINESLDHILRVFPNQGIVTTITNLTNLNQRIVIYTFLLQVQTEQDYNELERRLAAFQSLTQRLAVGGGA